MVGKATGFYELRETIQRALCDFSANCPERPAKIELSPAMWSRYVLTFHRPGSLQQLESDLRFEHVRLDLVSMTFMGIPVEMSETSMWPEIVIKGRETFAGHVRRKSLDLTDAIFRGSED